MIRKQHMESGGDPSVGQQYIKKHLFYSAVTGIKPMLL